MSFSVQTDAGGVIGATAYITVLEFKAYHDDREGDYGTATDPEIQAAIIRATDYLDQRFRFVGERITVQQRTAWPRVDAFDRDDNLRQGIPTEIKEATAEYALRALTAALNPDLTRDESGQIVISKSETVGPISQSVTFAGGGAFIMPRYPAADSRLTTTGLVASGNDVGRA